jgi:hypothetical protein
MQRFVNIDPPSSSDVQEIADGVAQSALSASVSRQRNRVAPKSSQPPGFESGPGSIPVGTLWRPERHGARFLFLPADSARQLVGIAVGISNNRRENLS